MQERRNTRTEKSEMQNTFTIRMFELWSKKTPRREKSNSFKGISKKRCDKGGEKTEKINGETKAAERTTKGQCKRPGEAEQARAGESERERGVRKTKSSYVSRDKTATGERRSSQCSLSSL